MHIIGLTLPLEMQPRRTGARGHSATTLESGITPPLGMPFDVSFFMLQRHMCATGVDARICVSMNPI